MSAFSSRRKRSSRYDSKRQSAYLPKAEAAASNSPPPQKNEEALNPDEPIVPGKILSIQKRKVSLDRSDHVLPTNVVRESFHRRAGIREMVDTSGAYKLRTVEIKRSHGESIGFYIRQGDGWNRNDGVFVSRVNLGSVVDVNDLLHIGEEIVKVNGVDIAGCPLNDVVALIQKKRNILRLTVKLPTSQAILRTFSAKQAQINQELPEEEESESDHDTIAAMDLLGDIAIHLESTPELSRPHQPLELLRSEHKAEAPSTPKQRSLTLQREISPLETFLSVAQKDSGDVREAHDRTKVSENGTLFVACDETKTSDNDSPKSSPPPTPPTSPVPALQDPPSSSPQVSMKHDSLPKFDEDSSTSSSCELTDSLKDLLSPLENLSPYSEECPSDSHGTQTSSSPTSPISSDFPTLHIPPILLPPSHPPTPPTSLPPTPPDSHPPTLLPPTPPTSHPPTPFPLLPSSQPPSPESSPPPLPKSPPPMLVYEPLTPDTPSHLSPPTTKPHLPSESDDEDIFRLKEVEDHLRHWLTHYENSGVDQYTSI